MSSSLHSPAAFANYLGHGLQAQKNVIESMIAEDDKIEGLEHIECKVFK